MSDTISKVLDMINDNNVEYVDFRFTDLRGVWHHTAQHASTLDADIFRDGILFDGSSIAGWKAINESDMVLMPDPETACLDPFTAQPQMILFCDVLEPGTGQTYDRDPRSIARRALTWMQSLDIADEAFFGPEAEFFIFDNARWQTEPHMTAYALDSEESPHNTFTDYESGNTGHRPRTKGGYFPAAPVDSAVDIRAEMATTMRSMGLTVEKHHHEVAPAQNELAIRFASMLRSADQIQIYKYVARMVAHSYGKTVTFMPKPILGDNGSGMHCHQSLWKGGKNLFAGAGYADLSETCLYYIGGIIKHARALNAFTNPSTNSYRRLVPGFEAPVLLAYSARNRSASCRIPYAPTAAGKRVEVRFPDPTANPYLAFAAMLMAGLDGVQNRIHPGEAMDKDLYDLPPAELKGVPTVARSLREALQALNNDRDFLKRGDVMTDAMIDSYLKLKQEDVDRIEISPHPVEFDLYYSL